MDILKAFGRITTFMFDVDGVLTDGGILVLETGDMARTMNTKDGYALQLAIKKGYNIFIITGGGKSGVEKRLNNLGIHEIYFQAHDKRTCVEELIKKYRLDKEEILFMGDDMPDVPAFDAVGMSACPADAVPDVKNSSMYVSPVKGGRGCVRDVLEKVMRARGDWGVDASIASK